MRAFWEKKIEPYICERMKWLKNTSLPPPIVSICLSYGETSLDTFFTMYQHVHRDIITHQAGVLDALISMKSKGKLIHQ